MAYLPRGWELQYEVDFSTLSNLNIKTGGNGNKTIDGKVWTWANDAAATTANVTNGSGIVVNPAAAGGSGNPATRTAPILYIPLNSLIPITLNIIRRRVRVMAQVSLTASTLDAQGVRLGMEDATAPTDQGFNIFKGHTGGANQFRFQSAKPTGAGSANVTDSANFSDDVLVVDWDPPDGWAARTGAFGTDFPISFPNFHFAEYLDVGNPSPTIRLQAEPRVTLIFEDSAGGGGGFTGTIKKLRVLMQEKFP